MPSHRSPARFARGWLFAAGLALCCCGVAKPFAAAPREPASTLRGASRSKHNAGGYQHDFSDVERFAARFDDPSRDAWQHPDEVVGLLRLASGDTVVDLGAGTGYFVRRLSAAVGPAGRVLALDVEPRMVEYLSERIRALGLANATARVVEAADPDLEPASVARVLIVNTWHHLGERPRYAAKLAEALRPGGEVWVVDFTPESELGPPKAHRLPAEQAAAELRAGGLRAEVAPESLPHQYAVRAWRSPPPRSP